MAFYKARVRYTRIVSFVDVFLFLGLVFFTYALIGVAKDWTSPFRPKVEIELGYLSLAKYSFFSLVRVTAAYFLSLVFTFTYGYVAAKSKLAEPVLISLLDILQSIPVLGFMPGVVLALVHLFPNSNVGLEIAAVIMIFTGEGWNLVFSFYSSLKGVPVELREMTRMLRLRRWDVLRTVEIPFAMNGLLWNSMLSMAGGWFFLMTIESQRVGENDFRLPGIGSYMAVAYERNDISAIVAGLSVMLFLIFLVDRCVWAPLVVWSERFKYEQDITRGAQKSWMLEFLKKSKIIEWYLDFREKNLKKIKSWYEKKFKEQDKKKAKTQQKSRMPFILNVFRVSFIFMGLFFLYFGYHSLQDLLSATTTKTWVGFARDITFTFLRVFFAVAIGSLWTIPVGVFIGTNPKWTSRLQPIIQMVASFPAPMLFPIFVYVMSQMGISFEIGSVVLMLFASQWYILFNVVSGATFIPRNLMDLGLAFRLSSYDQWKAIILPCIFPSLVNGWITAAGGAWNASIVAEVVGIGKNTLVATGIGATITQSANNGDYPTLAGGILVLVTVVVLLNRVLWGSLYKLSETKYRLEY